MINAIFYFMGSLKRDAGALLFFLLVSFSVSMSISMALSRHRLAHPQHGAGPRARVRPDTRHGPVNGLRRHAAVYARVGVVTGDMLVDGKPRDKSFQRKTGYVQQQDLHVHTSTVREALAFSALLRQTPKYSREEKLAYVETVIDLLDVQDYSDAIIGVPGEGLNVEERKMLIIGVKLAARPQLLLFLDEPTSGLDNQTSWSICNLMEKLTRNGQAVLCTIHRPSAILLQRFDRLLLLSKGKAIYFGDVGKKASVLVDYFARNGTRECPAGANSAEYMLDAIGAAPGSRTDIDWPGAWKASPGFGHSEFAAPPKEKFVEVTKRLLQQYWRSPGYIYSKSLFIGLTFFNGKNTERGLQNQMFGVMMILTIFTQVVNQMMPAFVAQRTMYEARERPSKTYPWKAFMGSVIIVEALRNSVIAVLSFVCWYFPTGLYRNGYETDSAGSRNVTVFLFIWLFFMFTSTFANTIIAGFDSDEVTGGVVTLVMIMIFSFAGRYLETVGGYIVNPEASNGSQCQYCTLSDTNAFLATRGVSFDRRWRDIGFMWAYILFNIVAALGTYWLVGVPKKKKANKE